MDNTDNVKSNSSDTKKDFSINSSAKTDSKTQSKTYSKMHLRVLPHKHIINVIAHRGFNAKYPENTLLSFEKAIETGADNIELDIHYSADNVLVVCHDSKTGRVGDKDLIIAESTVEELKTVDLGSGQTIPTLEEVLDLCKGKIGVQIEIKDAGIASGVVELVKSKNMESEVAFSSFVHGEIFEVKRLAPQIPAAVLEPTGKNAFKSIFKRSTFFRDAQIRNADGVHPFVKYVNKKFIDNAHSKGLFVNPWTVDSPETWEKLIKWGVDGIITNDPEMLIDFLNNFE